MEFLPHVDVPNSCKLLKHFANLGQTSSPYFIKLKMKVKTQFSAPSAGIAEEAKR